MKQESSSSLQIKMNKKEPGSSGNKKQTTNFKLEIPALKDGNEVKIMTQRKQTTR